MSLLERETQLQDLARALADADAQKGRTVLVTGEAGIGKTALVERFAADAAADHRILWGACEALFTPRPLGPFLDVVHALGGPLLARLENQAQPVDLFHGLIDDLRRHDRPTIVVLEDMHWADHATLDFVRFLARRIDKLPGLLLLTFRDDEVGADHPLTTTLGDLPATGRLRIRLPPLSRATVEDLARRSGRPVEELYRVTRGNPFFVTELLQADGAGVAPSIREAVVARARRLPADARAVLDLVSVSPESVPFATLRQACSGTIAGLEPCLERGLLALHADRVYFRHELARLAIEEALPPLQRREKHALMLATLEAQHARPGGGDVDPARLAHHAIAAGDGAAIARHAPAAARAASARGAHREAATLLEAVLPVTALLAPAERAGYFDQRARACHLMGQVRDAVAASEAAERLWREIDAPLAVACNLVDRCELLMWGRVDRPFAMLVAPASAAIALFEGPARDADPAEVAIAHAALAYGQVEAEPAAAEASLAVAVGRLARSTDPAWRLRALGVITMSEYFMHGAPDADHARTLMREARAQQSDLGIMAAYIREAWRYARERRLDELDRCIDEGLAFARDRQLDHSPLQHVMQRMRADAAAARGDWATAADNYRRMAAESSVAPWTVKLVYGRAPLALLAARRGEPCDRTPLDEGRARPAEFYTVDTWQFNRILAEVGWITGDLAMAQGAASALANVARQWRHPWALGEAAFWNHLLGRTDPLPDGLPEPYALLFAGDCERAADAWQQRDHPYEAALALACGDADRQREALRRLDALGAGGTAERVRERMRDQGLRAIPQGPRASTKAHPAGLTEREVEVLALLARGHTNGEIAKRLHRSVRTVEHHVAALTDKLGAANRQEAVVRARERGLVG